MAACSSGVAVTRMRREGVMYSSRSWRSTAPLTLHSSRMAARSVIRSMAKWKSISKPSEQVNTRYSTVWWKSQFCLSSPILAKIWLRGISSCF